MSKLNSISITMVVFGLIGLLVVYWIGIDGVLSRRRGPDITVSDNPMMFFFFLSIPLLVSLFSLAGGIFLFNTGRKMNFTEKSIDNLSELISKDIENSKEILEKMELNIKAEKTHNKSSKKDAANRASS